MSEMIFTKKQINGLNNKNDMKSLDAIFYSFFLQGLYKDFMLSSPYHLCQRIIYCLVFGCVSHMRTKKELTFSLSDLSLRLLCKFNIL